MYVETRTIPYYHCQCNFLHNLEIGIWSFYHENALCIFINVYKSFEYKREDIL